MPYCPSCHYEIGEPPKDVEDWFRCPGCGVPLKLPSDSRKLLLAMGIVAFIVIYIFLSILFRKLFPGWDIAFYLSDGVLALLSGVLLRLFWRTKFSRLSLHDPYSALNLSDSRKNLRGRN